MKSILLKCEIPDFEYISEVLDSYVSFTDDGKRKNLLANFKLNKSSLVKDQLVDLLDKQIRYFGADDLAYLFRSVFSEEAGISSNELVKDICKKLKVTVKQGGSLEAYLERLVKGVVEKELLSKTPEELRKAFKDFGIGEEKAEQVLDFLKNNGKVAVIPVLLEILGPAITLTLIEAIIVGLIAAIVGREAAKIIVREIVKRNPWLAALGPVVWVAGGAWLIFDLQGPAYRKTVPICLYLGIVALRDGPVDGDSFYAN